MNRYYILIVMGVSLASCEKQDTIHSVEKGGYPLTHPLPSPHPASSPIEKPNMTEDFFETDKLL